MECVLLHRASAKDDRGIGRIIGDRIEHFTGRPRFWVVAPDACIDHFESRHHIVEQRAVGF